MKKLLQVIEMLLMGFMLLYGVKAAADGDIAMAIFLAIIFSGTVISRSIDRLYSVERKIVVSSTYNYHSNCAVVRTDKETFEKKIKGVL